MIEEKTMEMVMNKKINVLDVQIDNNTAKEAMLEVMTYMDKELISVIELITSDVLVTCKENETLKYNIAQSDLVLAGDKNVLDLAEGIDRKKLQEAESHTFLRMLLRFFHKNKNKVFLLTATEEEKNKFKEYLHESYQGMEIVGAECVPEDKSLDDMILNNINATECDCIMSFLPSPMQEEFIARNKILLNARIWLGLGNNAHLPKAIKRKKPIHDFLIKYILKREVEKEKLKKRGNA